MSTDLEPVGSVTAETLLDRLGELVPVAAPKPAEPDAPLVELGPRDQLTLELLPAALAEAVTFVPPVANPLSGPERNQLRKARATVADAAALLKKVAEGPLRETIAADLDRVAEITGQVTADTPRDARGHYLIDRLAAPAGDGEQFRREVSGGKAKLDQDKLDAAYAAGLISSESYRAVTRPARVFDPVKAAAACAKDPDLLKLLAQHAATPTPVTVAVHVRKAPR